MFQQAERVMGREGLPSVLGRPERSRIRSIDPVPEIDSAGQAAEEQLRILQSW